MTKKIDVREVGVTPRVMLGTDLDDEARDDRIRDTLQRLQGQTTMHIWYHPERLNQISAVVQGMYYFAKPGLEIILGLEGDPALPTGFKRQKGIVVSVSRDEYDNPVIDVRLDSGEHRRLSNSSIAPHDLFEISPEWMRREIAKYGP